jgi:hypothetical protein
MYDERMHASYPLNLDRRQHSLTYVCDLRVCMRSCARFCGFNGTFPAGAQAVRESLVGNLAADVATMSTLTEDAAEKLSSNAFLFDLGKFLLQIHWASAISRESPETPVGSAGSEKEPIAAL